MITRYNAEYDLATTKALSESLARGYIAEEEGPDYDPTAEDLEEVAAEILTQLAAIPGDVSWVIETSKGDS